MWSISVVLRKKVLDFRFGLGSFQVRYFAKTGLFIGKSRFVVKLAFCWLAARLPGTGVQIHSGCGGYSIVKQPGTPNTHAPWRMDMPAPMKSVAWVRAGDYLCS